MDRRQRPPGVPGKVWMGLAIAVILDAPVQLMWKALMVKYGGAAREPHLVDFIHQVRWFVHQVRWFAHQRGHGDCWGFFCASFGIGFGCWEMRI